MTLEESLALLDLPEAITRQWIEQLREPHRHYHTLAHVQAMLGHYTGAHPGFVAAIWLHDIIYDPKASDNEERSADQARLDLPPGEDAELAVRLILGSKRHEGGDPWTEAFNDLDLGIIAAAPDHYDRYAEQIRQEYAFVPEAAYRVGRAEILRGFDQRRIFRTAEFAYLEDQAHSNLQREIARLVAGA